MIIECDCEEGVPAYACIQDGNIKSGDCPCLCHVVRTLRAHINRLEERVQRCEDETGTGDDF